MLITCVSCQKVIESGDYRIIGVERGTWRSMYAHNGGCADDARRRFNTRGMPPVAKPQPALPIEAEELTMEAPDPFPDADDPWAGLERRR